MIDLSWERWELNP